MKRIILFGLSAILIVLGAFMLWQRTSVEAQPLAIGAKAPNFTTTGALAGKEFRLTLSEQLAKGPVILYFFPKVFTKGCTLEANAFSEASPEIAAAGGQVIGMSADSIEELAKFSTEECRDKFAVAHASPAVIGDYGVSMAPGKMMTNRTSYVIAQDGRVAYVHSNLDYKDHVRLTVAELKKLAVQNP